MRRIVHISLLSLGLAALTTAEAAAQPIRQMPGTRPLIAGAIKQQGQPQVPNSRRRPAASSVGFESTDFYPKNGYPKQLGDIYEFGTTNTGAAGMGGQAGQAGGQAGNTGNTGVQAAGSNGFQGNTGNQIGQNGGGTVFGGLFGGNGIGGGAGGALGGGNNTSNANGNFTGGGFAGMVPKGFGFAGTPETTTRVQPLHGLVR